MAIIIILLLIIHSKAHVNSYTVCPEHEKQALLFFKNDLIDSANRLASWDPRRHHQDCCRWFGVVCDNRTGHVISLHLGLPPWDEDTTDYQSYQMSNLKGKIKPSLSNLKQLKYLDLSNNSFEGILPYQLGNLSNLEYLSLGSNYGSLHVENLNWLSGLSLLKHLDLTGMNLSRASNWLQVVNRELPSLVELHFSGCQLVPPGEPSLQHVNLSSLAILDLSSNSFKNQKDLGWLSKLNSLVFLNLGGNGFDGSIPDFLRNMSSLRHLDLSRNRFNTTIPHWLYSFSSLQVLRLNDNELQGDISTSIGNMTSLNEIDLSWNYELEGKLPKEMGGLCNLRLIDLSNMKLISQDISDIFGILSGCSSHILESLWLKNCQLSGQLPDEVGHFENLKQLSLADNSISGPIPTSLGKLANLETVYIQNNLLEGVVSEKHFANHTKLEFFLASGNSLVLRVNPMWLPPFQLRYLYLRSWKIGPSFPLWLRSQKHLKEVDISNSRISDTIPSWFWRFSTQFSFLNLSTNQISGQLSLNYGARDVVDLSFNNFSGPLPHISGDSNRYMINLSNNSFSGSLFHFLCYRLNDTIMKTMALNLANNLLSGEIPDCWIKWPSLQSLQLDGNKFSGKIPTSMGSLRHLQSLNLHNNKLHGEIPFSLKNCTALVVINLAKNDLSGSIPGWLGQNLPGLTILILRSNKFRGNIPDHLCALTSLQILDIADNKLFGSIPRCISDFTAMVRGNSSSDISIKYFYDTLYLNFLYESASVVIKGQSLDYGSTLNLVRLVDLSRNNLSGEIPKEVASLQALQTLNLSGNHFTGKIPENICAMKLLETLDLSQNQLSGSIPGSMATMTLLNHLNLSFNNFIGRIPTSTQLQSFNESCYAGNHLCGFPLKDCESTGKESEVRNGAKGTVKGHEINWFYVSMPIGFVTGFWCVMGPLVFNRRWRIIYFRFLEETWCKLCDFVRYLCHFVL